MADIKDTSKALYKLENAKLQAREEDFRHAGLNRRGELSTARALLESAINSGDTKMAVALLATIEKTARGQWKEDLATHALLTKPAVKRFMDKLVDIMAEIIKKHLPNGFENCLLEISENMDAAFAVLQNTPQELDTVKLLR